MLPLVRVPVGVYLTRDSNTGEYQLIDGGAPGQNEQIKAAIAEFFADEATTEQAALQKLSSVFVTHFHLDHVALLPDIEKLAPQVPIYCHEQELPFVRDGRRIKDQQSHSWVFSLAKHFAADAKDRVPSAKSIMQANIHELDFHNIKQSCSACAAAVASEADSSDGKQKRSLHYTHCPGHTPGHCCFYHADDNAIIVGDAIMCLNARKGLEMSPGPSTPDPVLAKSSILAIAEALPEGTLMLPMHDTTNGGFRREAVLEFLRK